MITTLKVVRTLVEQVHLVDVGLKGAYHSRCFQILLGKQW